MSAASRSFRRRQLLRMHAAARCPDCNSEVSIARLEVQPGAPTRAQIRVGHDDTCPAWRRRGGGEPFREVLINWRTVDVRADGTTVTEGSRS